MPSELFTALAPLLARAQKIVHADPILRAEVIALGKALQQWAELSDKSTPLPAPVLVHPEPRTLPRSADPSGSGTFSPTRPLQQNHEVQQDEQLGWMPQEPTIIAARCRLKAEAARLVAGRHRGVLDDEKYLGAVAELRGRAEKVPKCTLWMLDMQSLSRAAVVWDDLSGGYDTAADAAELIHAVTEPDTRADKDQVLTALNLAAEAQALLFAGVIDTNNPRSDADQIQLYVTVRELASARNTYIHRYLRREDRIDPRSWPDLKKRLAVASEPFHDFKRKSGVLKKVMANLRYKLAKAAQAPSAFDDWPRTMELVDEAIGGGLSPASAELRDMLLPVAEAVPDDLPLTPHVLTVFQELDKHLTTAEPRSESPELEVPRAAELLAGKTLVLVGGLVRTQQKAVLEQAFPTTDVVWWSSPSLDGFEAVVSDPRVFMVLDAVRWSAPQRSDQVRAVSDRFGKPVTVLPGSYHPNAVARAVLATSSAR